jgi:hypothetical protein
MNILTLDISIIAVPGLGAHPLGSWKSPKDYVVWLRDILPKDLEKGRILLYGYDTNLRSRNWKKSIDDLAKGFLEQIKGAHSNEYVSCAAKSLLPQPILTLVQSKKRPIIFLGHSLGGLVIKEVLPLSYRRKNFQFGQLENSG